MKTINAKIYNKLTELGLKNVKAFTLDEILDMLPSKIIIKGSGYMWYHFELYLKKMMYTNIYLINYKYFMHGTDEVILEENDNTNPAEAAGTMLIWCIKNGHVKVEDLNNENN